VFAKLPHVHLPQSTPQERARSAHHLYVALFDFAGMRTTRTEFMTQLAARGIGSQVHYMPVYHHPFHAQRKGVDRNQFAQAEHYYSRCLSLPLHAGLTDGEIERVIVAVSDLVTAA
jgi:dTDP-4-amino-4,6-dideoxygalactose transaminase